MLVIKDGKPIIVSADHVWGKKIGDSVDLIHRDYPEASTAVIGPAGENKVRFANVVCDKSHQASRAGMGAVMGSKI